ncbi:hypothetical protein MMYC01_208045 [Madurella mycetomatis]|uniref:NWD NACHT-NTPase N-terminal domain-containing protein n=1 Tax=Madurella mycetomatis TaxID=100816 RepID=A0A175VVF6_9PEZI|nr:hypothetical protein MMYC01_208045 [Madurella mycetomatis]
MRYFKRLRGRRQRMQEWLRLLLGKQPSAEASPLSPPECHNNHAVDRRGEVSTVEYVPFHNLSMYCEDQSRGQSLWDRAYDELRAKDPELVKNYETLLSKELKTSGPY